MLDTIARGLASGMSRREALRAGGVALVGAAALTPADAWAKLTASCPSGRVLCRGTCCPRGELCLGTGTARHCGCAHHLTRCNGRCVNLQTSVANCGRCGHVCPKGATCSSGHCHCPTGQSACAGACVNLAHNHQNCGSCGHACASNQVCSSGQCVLQCPTGQTNCSGSCVDLQSNALHCGSCTTACTLGQSCVGGTCQLVCPQGQTNCSGTCTDLTSNHDNCGQCGAPCDAVSVCSQGACVPNCPSGQTDCHGSCVDLGTDVGHCGGCDSPCNLPNATATCVSGLCAIATCDSGFKDCNNNPADGCETNITTTSACGDCGTVCQGTNATNVTCSGGICQQTCNSGFKDCNHNPADGCETDITTTSNCGDCGNACGAGQVCFNASCCTPESTTTACTNAGASLCPRTQVINNCGQTVFCGTDCNSLTHCCPELGCIKGLCP